MVRCWDGIIYPAALPGKNSWCFLMRILLVWDWCSSIGDEPYVGWSLSAAFEGHSRTRLGLPGRWNVFLTRGFWSFGPLTHVKHAFWASRFCYNLGVWSILDPIRLHIFMIFTKAAPHQVWRCGKFTSRFRHVFSIQPQLAGSNAKMLLRLANAELVPVSLGEQPEGAHGGGQMLDAGGFGGWFFWNCCSWKSQESWLVEWKDWSDFYWRIRDDEGFFAMLRCCGEPERYEGATGAWGRSFGECGCLVCIRLVASFSKFQFQYILYIRHRLSLESVCRFRCCFPAFRIARNRLECHRVTSPSEVRNTASVMPITRASTPFLHLSSSTPSVHVTWNQWIHCRWMYIQRWHGDFFFQKSCYVWVSKRAPLESSDPGVCVSYPQQQTCCELSRFSGWNHLGLHRCATQLGQILGISSWSAGARSRAGWIFFLGGW